MSLSTFIFTIYKLFHLIVPYIYCNLQCFTIFLSYLNCAYNKLNGFSECFFLQLHTNVCHRHRHHHKFDFAKFAEFTIGRHSCYHVRKLSFGWPASYSVALNKCVYIYIYYIYIIYIYYIYI